MRKSRSPLTLGRIIKQHKKNPKDKTLHKKIEKGKISLDGFLRFLRNA